MNKEIICKDCGNKNLESIIDGICIYCAEKNWRMCQRYIYKYKRCILKKIDDPKSVIDKYLNSLIKAGTNDARKVELSTGSFIELQDLLKNGKYTKKQIDDLLKSKGFKEPILDARRHKYTYEYRIKNVIINDIPSDVLDSYYLLNYSLYEKQQYDIYDYVYIRKNDMELISSCERYFKPQFLYQILCNSCHNITEKRILSRPNKNNFPTIQDTCIVCGSSFTTHNYKCKLCEVHRNKYLVCLGCGRYFVPYNDRASESYCYLCRKKIQPENEDLLGSIIRNTNFNTYVNTKLF